MANAMDRSTVLCAACESALWSCFTLSNGQPVIAPVSPEVPYYRDGLHSCPYCDQPIYIERSGQMKAWMRDERTGRLMIA